MRGEILPAHYLEDALRQFRQLKALADRAVAQVAVEDLFVKLDEESNSIAIIMKHLAGNMRSRWTDFLTSDGEKPDRNRDSEFVIEAGDTKDSVVERWEVGWRCLFEALTPLTAEDLSRTVLIRGEPHSVMEAINRQLTHYAYHVGQIVFLAKHLAASRWQSLSIPRGKSEEFNAAMREKGGSSNVMPPTTGARRPMNEGKKLVRSGEVNKPIVLFDGVCNFCNSIVIFTIKRDPEGRFTFASLQSSAGQNLLRKFNLPTNEFGSFVLVENDRYYSKSTAALKVVKRLKGLWPVLYAFIVVPKPIRDFVYDFIAKNRYQWFGRKDQCMVPTADVKRRFLD